MSYLTATPVTIQAVKTTVSQPRPTPDFRRICRNIQTENQKELHNSFIHVFVLKESHKIETSETISVNRCQPILDLRAWSAMGLLAPDSVLAAHGAVAHVVCACAMK